VGFVASVRGDLQGTISPTSLKSVETWNETIGDDIHITRYASIHVLNIIVGIMYARHNFVQPNYDDNESIPTFGFAPPVIG